MDSISLRILAKKSTLNFGKYKDCTVEKLIGMRKQIDLTSMYFKLSKISFNEEILEELGITSEFRILKPSTNKELYLDFLLLKYGKKQRPNKKLQALQKQTKNLTKSQLQSINHSR
jgi:hypothetical protein